MVRLMSWITGASLSRYLNDKSFTSIITTLSYFLFWCVFKNRAARHAPGAPKGAQRLMLYHYFFKTAFRTGVRIAAAMVFMVAVPRTITAYIANTARKGTPLMPAPTIRAKV